MPISWIHRLLINVCGLPLLMMAGCSSLDLSDYHLPGSKPKPKVPTRMLDVWTDTILNQTGQSSVRGFGGRLTFFGDMDSKPVMVDGTLTVYAFDATDNDPVHAVPERKFVFSAEQMAKHQSKSKLGYSYSIWIPWDEVGNEERELMLMTRFEAQTGEIIMSSPSRHTLPGTTPPAGSTANIELRKTRVGATISNTKADTKAQQASGTKADKYNDANAVKPVSYETPMPASTPAATPASDPSTSTFTIEVPQNFAQKALAGANAPAATTATPETVTTKPTAAAATARSTDSTTESSPSASSAPSRFPVRRATTVPLKRDPVRRQPHPAGWPSQLPPTPRSAPSAESLSTPSTAESKSN